MEERNYQRRGYLKESFRLFHLRDIGVEEMEYHYHEFHKAVFFLAGSAGYLIEGRSYFLQPGDVLLVGRHLIHRPVIDPTRPYERVVLYLDPELLDGALSGEESLARCFQLARERRFALMRPAGEDRQALAGMLSRREEVRRELASWFGDPAGGGSGREGRVRRGAAGPDLSVSAAHPPQPHGPAGHHQPAGGG